MRVAKTSSSPVEHEPRCDPDQLRQMKCMLLTFGIEAARQATEQAAQMMAAHAD
jgi:hypothetical protein